jgi:hypothetical protein
MQGDRVDVATKHRDSTVDRAKAEALVVELLRERQLHPDSGPTQAEREIDRSPSLALAVVDVIAADAAGSRPDRDERIQGGILLLRVVFERLRVNLDRQRPESVALNELLQKHIAETLLVPGQASAFAAEVVRNLADSWLEPLPLLAEAFQQRLAGPGNNKVIPLPGVDPLDGLLSAMEAAGTDNPFDRYAFLVDQFRLAPEALLLQLAESLAAHPSPLLRELAGLMLFHPLPVVREQAPPTLLAAGADRVSPETLRRLILCRNWFAGRLREDVDLVISAVRRAGIPCTPLTPLPVVAVYASPVDGAGAQGFWVIAPEQGNYRVASILLKPTQGIVDAWVTLPVPAAEVGRIAREFTANVSARPVAPWLLERMVNHGLAIGSGRFAVPPVGLLRVAETIGLSGWKRELVSPERLLVDLRQQLGPVRPDERRQLLVDSEAWPLSLPFAVSWFEDDHAVDALLAELLQDGTLPPAAYSSGVAAVLEQILLPRRGRWVERLALTTLWLTAVTDLPPLAPEQLLLVAEEVSWADSFSGIGLMRSVARLSVDAFLERRRNLP